MDENLIILAQRLKLLREEKEVMQKQVATLLNITTSAYGFYEQGKRTPSPDSLNKLADFYNVSTDYLLGRSDTRNPNIKEESKNLSPEVETIAAHLEEKAENITPHKMKMLKRYIDDLFEDFDE